MVKVLDGPVHIDFTAPGEAPPTPREMPHRLLAIEPPQRAATPYPFSHVTLCAGWPTGPATSLSAGPFTPRRAWSGTPDEQRYTHLLIALTNALPGREEEFDDWYWNQHFPDGQRLPGCYAACRFALAAGGAGPFHHLALYQLDEADAAVIVDAHAKRAGTAAMPISSAISPVFQAWYARPLSGWSRPD